MESQNQADNLPPTADEHVDSVLPRSNEEVAAGEHRSPSREGPDEEEAEKGREEEANHMNSKATKSEEEEEANALINPIKDEERDDEDSYSSLVITVEDDTEREHHHGTDSNVSSPSVNQRSMQAANPTDEGVPQGSESRAEPRAYTSQSGAHDEKVENEDDDEDEEIPRELTADQSSYPTHIASVDDGVLLPAVVPISSPTLMGYSSMDAPELKASIQELIQTRAIRMETYAARHANNNSSGGGRSGKKKSKKDRDRDKEEKKEKKREKKAKKKMLKASKASAKTKAKDKKAPVSFVEGVGAAPPAPRAADCEPAPNPTAEPTLASNTTSIEASTSNQTTPTQRLSVCLSEPTPSNDASSASTSVASKADFTSAVSDKDSRTEDLSISSADDDRLESERETESESVGGREEDADESETFADFDEQQDKDKLDPSGSPLKGGYVVPDPQLVKKFCLFDHAEALAGFNANPQKGMRDMIQRGLLSEAPEDVALFLYCCKRLDKAQVGEFLGDQYADPLNALRICINGSLPSFSNHMISSKGLGRDVLDHFVRLFNFTDLDFDIALRRFLSYFRLPGEAQKIDRIMSAFATQFYSHNKHDVFLCSDAVYILAFAVIMLNTDAHNPNVKKKMTEQEFIRTNRGINEGQDIPPDYLSDIYCRITTNEIKMERESFPDALKMGWVWIKGDSLDERLVRNKMSSMRLNKRKTPKLHWHRLWFIFCESGLHFYQDVRLTQPVGAVSLREVKHQVLTDETDEEELRRVRENDKKKLLGSHIMVKLITLHPGATSLGERIFYLALPTQREVDVWVSLLAKCLSTLSQTLSTYSPPSPAPHPPPAPPPPPANSAQPTPTASSSLQDVAGSSPRERGSSGMAQAESFASAGEDCTSSSSITPLERPPVPTLALGSAQSHSPPPSPQSLAATSTSSLRGSSSFPSSLPSSSSSSSSSASSSLSQSTSTVTSSPPKLSTSSGVTCSSSPSGSSTSPLQSGSVSMLAGPSQRTSVGVVYSPVPPPPALWSKQGSPRSQQLPPPLAGRAMGRVGGYHPPPPMMSGGQLYSFSGGSPHQSQGAHHQHAHHPPSPPTPPPEHRPVQRRVIRLKTNTSIVPPSIFDL